MVETGVLYDSKNHQPRPQPAAHPRPDRMERQHGQHANMAAGKISVLSEAPDIQSIVRGHGPNRRADRKEKQKPTTQKVK